MSKKNKNVLIIYLIIFLMYVTVFFAVPFPKNECAWIQFAFSVISVIVGGFTTIHFMNSKENLRSKFYGFPVIKICFFYTAIQIVCGLIFCILGLAFDVPVWIALLTSILIIGISLIGMITSEMSYEIITEQETKVELKTKNITFFRLDIQHISDICKDEKLKKKIEKLSDDFKFSDPVSDKNLTEIEGRLRSKTSEFDSIVNSDINKSNELVDEISQLLTERNRMCKALKSSD